MLEQDKVSSKTSRASRAPKGSVLSRINKIQKTHNDTEGFKNKVDKDGKEIPEWKRKKYFSLSDSIDYLLCRREDSE